MKTVAFSLFLTVFSIQAQSYPPAAGESGSTAIATDSPLFVAWATGITVERGLVDISNPTTVHMGSNFASFGQPEDALGPATNSPVSLGDAGVAVLTFSTPIGDGPGFDFAVFENSFSDTFLELAFVEVSSDGTNYFRFPSHSETQTSTQVDGFGDLDPTFLNNLAGKYRALFGTPFDISALDDDPLLDKNAITHVKIVDVVGSIAPEYASYDSFGNAINDPFSTPFWTGGFDLDAVGVINQGMLSVSEFEKIQVSIYPNPVAEQLFVKTDQSVNYKIFDIQGREMLSGVSDNNRPVEVFSLQNGLYVFRVITEEIKKDLKFIKK
ncbi:T9SS type A sorting domain-containing protein [Winogradskyella sp.]|uniref:T9SS type A sorting domain-containing protein n=1 Tax=Winogradskyella sp. TaxID=1883156 RepID=UPI00262971C3|nr:T9SS type A sorting domain-containing protein [Winogradskyella sp.]